MNEEYEIIDIIKHEIKPIINYLNLIKDDGYLVSIGLKSNWSYKDLINKGVIDCSEKQLIRLLDYLIDNRKETLQAIEEIQKENIK